MWWAHVGAPRQSGVRQDTCHTRPTPCDHPALCAARRLAQMVLPAALAPLLKARAFVLVGDHNQLPPLVACKEAEAGGLADSLFKRLSDAHPQARAGAGCWGLGLLLGQGRRWQQGMWPFLTHLAPPAPVQAVVQLPVQYRMAADIMALPNALIYGGALRCGSGERWPSAGCGDGGAAAAGVLGWRLPCAVPPPRPPPSRPCLCRRHRAGGARAAARGGAHGGRAARLASGGTGPAAPRAVSGHCGGGGRARVGYVSVGGVRI